jgi:hypothetical protein
MNRSLFYLFSICLIAVGCGNLQVNYENEIEKGLFDSVLNKTNKSYLAIKELTTSDQRKIKIDSIVNGINTKFRHETFEAWTPIAMSAVLFNIDSNLLSISSTCTWTK